MSTQMFESGNAPSPKKPEEMTPRERSKRFGIKVRDDGNAQKSPAWLSSSRFIDPVNWLGAIWDSDTAKAVRTWFINDGGYDEKSQRVVRSRLNRLLRKFGVEPVGGRAVSFALAQAWPGGTYLFSDEDPELAEPAMTPELAEAQARQRRLSQAVEEQPETLVIGARSY